VAKKRVKSFAPQVIEIDLKEKPVALNGKVVDEYDLEKELRIDPTQLDEELIAQPSKFAWIATLHEYAKDFAQQKKMEFEEVKAELDIQVREAAAKEGTKVTEAVVKNMVTQMDSFKEAQAEYFEVSKLANLLGVGVTAFHQRANMLISFSANRRVELDGEITALAKKYRKKIDKDDDDDD